MTPFTHQWEVLVTVVPVPQNARNFLPSCATISFWRNFLMELASSKSQHTSLYHNMVCVPSMLAYRWRSRLELAWCPVRKPTILKLYSFFSVFPDTFRGSTSNRPTAASFHILSNSSVTKHPTIWRHMVSQRRQINHKRIWSVTTKKSPMHMSAWTVAKLPECHFGIPKTRFKVTQNFTNRKQ
jgi:hypothetical protein